MLLVISFYVFCFFLILVFSKKNNQYHRKFVLVLYTYSFPEYFQEYFHFNTYLKMNLLKGYIIIMERMAKYKERVIVYHFLQGLSFYLPVNVEDRAIILDAKKIFLKIL